MLLLAGCAPGPEPIAYGEHACDHCHMAISDRRFGAELVTARGRVYRFDAVECLAAFYRDAGEVRSVWVTDHARPGELIPAENAVFAHSAGVRSPMGLGLAAFSPEVDRDSLARALPGEILDWPGVVALVGHAWPGGRPAGMRGPHPS
jgi:copper chaperone NosL